VHGSTLNGGVVINELGADADTRIEGDTDANLFFVDASTDNVGFGTNTPEYKTDTVGSTRVAETAAQNGYEVAPGSTNILTSYNRTTATWLPLRQRANQHEFYCDGVETLRLDSSGNLGLGTTSPTSNSMSLWTNATERARITAAGDLLVGTTRVAALEAK
jgi:hypothetical protein